ncbi:MAG: 2-C-methyl-D-erythritol 2,4-cyclodiphosphate synthase [Treponema sp.]|nr:2-C-methyl-D-erythritol 2,4-cyclodiphosphate synthase [Treponema sp.]
MQIAIILTAAGSSTRMGTKCKKEYLPLLDGTVLSTGAKIFFSLPNFSKYISFFIVTHPVNGKAEAEKALFTDESLKSIIEKNNTRLLFTEGGKDREESVRNALLLLEKEQFEKNGLVLIHDGARPYVTKKIIEDVITTTVEKGSAVPALQPTDTQKEIDSAGRIIRHLKRSSLAAVQTPQGFIFAPLLSAHKKAAADKNSYTDDTEIWDKYSGQATVQTVQGDSCNKKITWPEDIPMNNNNAICIHTGLGYDLHPLVEGRKLLLGGIVIPYEKGEAGHSDGDVLLHAITDALLGASGLGDIGSYFPPTDAKWKDADSKELLKKVWFDIKKAGWNLVNLDAVIALEKPKFLPYRNEVIKSIADILEVKENQVFVKAKTGEKMGKIGRGEAIEVYASCLLQKV